MACQIKSKDQLKSIVLKALRKASGEADLDKDTEWKKAPLLYSEDFLRGFYFPVNKAVKDQGCQLAKFTSDDCANADTPQDVIDTIAKELKLK